MEIVEKLFDKIREEFGEINKGSTKIDQLWLLEWERKYVMSIYNYLRK